MTPILSSHLPFVILCRHARRPGIRRLRRRRAGRRLHARNLRRPAGHAANPVSNASNSDPPTIPDSRRPRRSSRSAPRRAARKSPSSTAHDQPASSVTYAYEVTPQPHRQLPHPADHRPGRRPRRSRPGAFDFVASKSETGDLLFVEVAGKQKQIYVGQSLDLTLKIWLRPYRDREPQHHALGRRHVADDLRPHGLGAVRGTSPTNGREQPRPGRQGSAPQRLRRRRAQLLPVRNRRHDLSQEAGPHRRRATSRSSSNIRPPSASPATRSPASSTTCRCPAGRHVRRNMFVAVRSAA